MSDQGDIPPHERLNTLSTQSEAQLPNLKVFRSDTVMKETENSIMKQSIKMKFELEPFDVKPKKKMKERIEEKTKKENDLKLKALKEQLGMRISSRINSPKPKSSFANRQLNFFRVAEDAQKKLKDDPDMPIYYPTGILTDVKSSRSKSTRQEL